MLKKILKNHCFIRKNNQNFGFCYTYHNLPTIHKYYYNETKVINDEEIEKYSIYIQAFLEKRRPLKYEIPPKISILKTSRLYLSQFRSQTNNNNEFVELPLNTLSVLFDNADIDTNYIKNIFVDKNEDNLYETIMHKVIVNGY